MFLAVGDRDFGATLGGLRLREGPDRLGAVGGGDRHPDPRAGAIGVALVVEGDGDLDEFVGGKRRHVGFPQAQHRLERGALLGVELALVSPQPAVLHEVSLPSGLTSLIVA